VFGQLTPFPSTPLYKRLKEGGRLTRPRHWLEFAPYQMAHTPLRMSIAQAQAELDKAWADSYSPERNEQALLSIKGQGINYRLIHFVMRMFFRGIYFPQMTKRAWLRLLAANRRPLWSFTREAISLYLARRKRRAASRADSAPVVINNEKTEVVREG
jgi:hypothetical protein